MNYQEYIHRISHVKSLYRFSSQVHRNLPLVFITYLCGTPVGVTTLCGFCLFCSFSLNFFATYFLFLLTLQHLQFVRDAVHPSFPGSSGLLQAVVSLITNLSTFLYKLNDRTSNERSYPLNISLHCLHKNLKPKKVNDKIRKYEYVIIFLRGQLVIRIIAINIGRYII